MSPHVNDPSASSITSAVTPVVYPVFITFLIGILFLMAGISLAAWMHSKLMGVISLILIVMSCIGMTAVLVAIMNIFPNY